MALIVSDLSITSGLFPATADTVVAGDLIYQRLSALAYGTEIDARIKAPALGFAFLQHVTDEATGADAMIFTNDKELVVAFRGTQRNYKDILTDLNFSLVDSVSPIPGERFRVHRGFMAQWRGIRAEIRDTVSWRYRRVVFTGHSLGGALAELASVELGIYAPVCVTFGAPRVGDKSFTRVAKARNVTRRRYVFGADIVPIVPLMAMGFRHVARPIYLTRGRRAVHGCPIWRELIGRARSLLTLKWSAGWSWCPVPTRIYTDHRVGEYGGAMSRIGGKG